MSYIKTRGEIYDTKDLCQSIIRDMEIVKQADNIPELLNKYIVVTRGSNYSYKIYSKYQFGKLSTKYLKGKLNEQNTQIYGAIWTIGSHREPILKSVSQMNDKLEMELL